MPGLHASEKLYFEYEDISSRVSGATIIPTNTSAVNIETATFCPDRDTNNNISIPHDDILQCDKTNRSRSSGEGNECHRNQQIQPRQQQQQQQQYHHQKQMSSPYAMIDLFSRQDQWFAHHPDIAPPPKTQTRILPRHVPHYIEVELEVPESEHNKNLGMFGVWVQLQSSNRTLLASSIRTVRMPHESKWISVVRKAICIVPLMLGALQENRRVLVPSFRFFVESDRLPLVRRCFATFALIPSPPKRMDAPRLTPSLSSTRIGFSTTSCIEICVRVVDNDSRESSTGRIS
jgi:hypothetical protein